MSAFRDFVAASLADIATPGLRRPVEDIIYETLDRRQIPSRTDFHEIRDLLNGLRGQVSGAVNGLTRLIESDRENGERLDQLEEQFEQLSASTQDPSQNQVSSQVDSSEEIASLKNHIDLLESKIEALEAQLKQNLNSAVQTTTVQKTTKKVCAVPGCNQNVRARGFCQPHYQKWKRNTLPGFINSNNQIKTESGDVLTLDKKYSGKPYSFIEGVLYIEGKQHAL